MKDVVEGTRKIVVAEKDDEVRTLLSEFLRLQGYAVTEFDRPGCIPTASLPEAPDLFLLGHGISEEEIFQTLDAVRAAKGFDGIPVIVIAVDPDEGFLVEAVSRGADTLLPFPFPMEVLHARVEDLLNGRRTSLVP